MKQKASIKHRMFIPREDGELVDIHTLSEQERKKIGDIAFTRLADSLMWSQGYERERNQDDNNLVLVTNNNKGA